MVRVLSCTEKAGRGLVRVEVGEAKQDRMSILAWTN
jgi:hypothetical protein